MFSLFVVILSIVIAIALLLVAFVYGADVITRASSSTAATGLVVEATQISNAVIAAQAEGLSLPNGETPHLDSRFLSRLPVPPLMAYAHGRPAAEDWAYFDGMDHALVLDNRISVDTCFAVNRKQGVVGIPALLQSGLVAQCYGEDEPFTFYFRAGVADAADAASTLAGSTLCPDGSRVVDQQCREATKAPSVPPLEELRRTYARWTLLVRRFFA